MMPCRVRSTKGCLRVIVPDCRGTATHCNALQHTAVFAHTQERKSTQQGKSACTTLDSFEQCPAMF